MLSFFPLDALDEIWDLIESVPGGFHTYSCSIREEESPRLVVYVRKKPQACSIREKPQVCSICEKETPGL